jgi:hypothetical protein
MVSRGRLILVLLSIAVILSGCDLFTSPLPGFLSGVEERVTVDVDSILSGSRTAPGVRYDLEVIGTGSARRLLLQVSPPSDPETFAYNDRLIVMTLDMQEEIRLEAETTIDYISRPFGYGHDGSLLAGYSVYQTPLSLSTPVQVLDPPHGLEGFITTDGGPATRLFSVPSGRFSAFHLEIRSYNLTPWSLVPDAQTIEIVPDGLSLSGNTSLAQEGYQLLGIGRDGGEIRFLFSRPSEQEIIGVAATLSEVVDAGLSPRPVLIPDADAPLFTISADRPEASADNDGFFLLRRNGWFERYDWSGALVARVTGDTSFTRRYAFDVEGGKFYRFDPASATLTRIGRWW